VTESIFDSGDCLPFSDLYVPEANPTALAL
jgi:hypothetical protein